MTLKQWNVMKIKNSLYAVCIFLPLLGFSQTSIPTTELEKVESEIQILRSRLYQNQLHQMRQEIESQDLMLANWKGYGKEIEHIRKQEEEERQIEEQIRQLEAKRQHLLKQS